jgi:hypothetical protein
VGNELGRAAPARRDPSRPRQGDPSRGCTTRFHGWLDRRSLRTGLRRRPAQTPAGSAGNARRSYMAGAGGRLALGKDKPSDSVVFPATRHAFLACVVRGMPGILGRTSGPEVSPSAARGAGATGWGRMTVCPAVESPGSRTLSEAPFFATQFGGRTSKKIRRRVERNPV